jgi:hypothetical protein
MLKIRISEELNIFKNTIPTLSIPKRVVLEKKKKQEKSIHYANTLSICSYDQQLYYVSSVIPPYINSICSFSYC